VPVEERVEDLLKRTTLEEKVAQMRSIWDAKSDVFDAKLEFDPAKMAKLYPDGIGPICQALGCHRPDLAAGASRP